MGMGSMTGRLERIAQEGTKEMRSKHFISEMWNKVPDTTRASLLATYVSQGYVFNSMMRRYRKMYA